MPRRTGKTTLECESQASNYEAELGRAGGAVTNVILKSGSNSRISGSHW